MRQRAIVITSKIMARLYAPVGKFHQYCTKKVNMRFFSLQSCYYSVARISLQVFNHY